MSIDEIAKIGHTITVMFGFFLYKKPKKFALTLTVGPWSPDQVVAIPYPIQHQQQTVHNLSWTSDGIVTDHGGYLIVTNGTQATVTAKVRTEPFVSSSDQPVIRQCYDETIATLHYGAPIPGLYTLADVRRLPEVDCGGFSVYLLSLLAIAHVEARLVAGFWAGYSNNTMHAWVEALLPNGTWFPLDTSTDWLRQRRRTKKMGGYGELGSDRIVISVGSDHVIQHQQQTYTVGMLQLPMILAPDKTFSYLPYDHYRLITQH